MALAEKVERAPVPVAPPKRRRRFGGVLAVLWFVAVAVYATWPLLPHLADRIPYGLTDPLENAWIFGWGAHALGHNPLHLFDGNIYYPQAHTLAFAENMLGLSLPTAPLFWLTGSAIVQVNVASLLVLVSSGLGMFLLVRTLTGDWRAALLAGTAYEVVPYRMGQFSHLHVAGHLVPWALFVLVLLRRKPSWGTAGILAFIVGLQFWSSLTGGVVMLAACGAWALWVLLEERKKALAFVVRAAAGTVVGVMLAVPVFLPYLAVRRNNPEFTHPPEEAIFYSATPQSYLYPPAFRGPVVNEAYQSMNETFRDRQGWWEKTLWPGTFAFFGFIAAILGASIGFARGRPRRAWRRTFAGLSFVTGIAVVLSFGPRSGASADGVVLPFQLISSVVPAGLMRVPARFGVAAAATAIAATAIVISTLRPRWRNIVIGASIAIVLLEAMPPSLPLSEPPERTSAHARVADRPGAVLALPTTEYDAVKDTVVQPTTQFDAQHMYLSTEYFRPIVNGYAAFGPRTYWSLIGEIQDLPSLRGFAKLREQDVRTVIVETALLEGTRWHNVVEEMDGWPGVRRVATAGTTIVYDISGAW
jgi:hypothetical protein